MTSHYLVRVWSTSRLGRDRPPGAAFLAFLTDWLRRRLPSALPAPGFTDWIQESRIMHELQSFEPVVFSGSPMASWQLARFEPLSCTQLTMIWNTLISWTDDPYYSFHQNFFLPSFLECNLFLKTNSSVSQEESHDPDLPDSGWFDRYLCCPQLAGDALNPLVRIPRPRKCSANWYY